MPILCKSTYHNDARATYISMAHLQRESPSPWSPGAWKITMDFGREDSSDRNDNNIQLLSSLLGDEWGSNGGRLVLSFDVLASAEISKQQQNDDNDSWLGGKPTGTVETDDESCTYINEQGQQLCTFLPGNWRIEPPLPLLPTYTNILSGQASTLRFYLTINTPIRRNTISFPEEQLLLFQCNTFRKSQYSSGVQTLLPYQYAKERSQRLLVEQLNHETGDRRLDGNDLLDTLSATKEMAKLVIERDKMRSKWLEVESVLPKLDSSIDTSQGIDINTLIDDDEKWGIWPSDTELMTIESGIIYAVVNAKKEKQGFFQSLLQDNSKKGEPVVVGRWNAKPIFDF